MKNFKLRGDERLLSDVPSEALQQCLNDLRIVERDEKRYVVDMGHLHDPLKSGDYGGDTDEDEDTDEESDWMGPCYVCLGGARLARILDDPEKVFLSDDIDALGQGRSLKRAVLSMEQFRLGRILKGVAIFYGLNSPEKRMELEAVCKNLSPTDYDYNWPIGFPSYEEDYVEWWKAMKKMVATLKEAKL